MKQSLLVTGGSRGIGAAVALLAARQGWNVVVNYTRDAAAAQAVVQQVQATGRQALAVQADVGDEAQVTALFAAVDAAAPAMGPLRGLVNNAGIVDVASRVDAMDWPRLQRMFAVNVLGSFACARQALLRMSTRHAGTPLAQACGGGRGGSIVNLSSAAARLGAPGQYVDYAAAKGAIDTFTVGLAREVALEAVRVNGVRPGIIETDIHASGGEPDRAARMAPLVPMQRAGSAAEVAEGVVWLLSDAASYVTGTVLDIAGGR